MKSSHVPKPAGSPRFVEKRSSIVLQRPVGLMVVGLLLFFAPLFGTAAALGDLAVFPAAVCVASAFVAGLFVARRRRLLLFEDGFTIPFVRLRELLGPQPFLGYDSITSVRLSRPGGEWVWWIETGDERRLAIGEWVFNDKPAVHEFLLTKWPHVQEG